MCKFVMTLIAMFCLSETCATATLRQGTYTIATNIDNAVIDLLNVKTQNSDKEIHLILGGLPGDEHLNNLRDDVLYVYWDFGSRVESSEQAPVIQGDMNSIKSWLQLSRLFPGAFDKIFFDKSVVQAAHFSESLMVLMFRLLKRNGEVYVPKSSVLTEELLLENPELSGTHSIIFTKTQFIVHGNQKILAGNKTYLNAALINLNTEIGTIPEVRVIGQGTPELQNYPYPLSIYTDNYTVLIRN